MAKPTKPCECGGKAFWRGRVAESGWFCVVCRPPVVESMVGERFELASQATNGQAVGVEATGSLGVATGVESATGEVALRVTPMVRYYQADSRCGQCSGSLVQDTVRADGSWDVRCYTCRTIRASG